MSRSPLYERVESVLAGDIADGSLPPETQLPSEDGLVERFKVSRTTVRKAIQNLVERGLVEVRRGKGTFVTEPKITQELTELTGFVEDMQALGRTPTARLLDKRIVAADLQWPSTCSGRDLILPSRLKGARLGSNPVDLAKCPNLNRYS